MSVDYDGDKLIRELKEFLGIPKELTVSRQYREYSDTYLFLLTSPDKETHVSYAVSGSSYLQCQSYQDQVLVIKGILSKLWNAYQESDIESW